MQRLIKGCCCRIYSGPDVMFSYNTYCCVLGYPGACILVVKSICCLFQNLSITASLRILAMYEAKNAKSAFLSDFEQMVY